jgi:hypothetical protein
MKLLSLVVVAISSSAYAQPGALDVSGNYTGTWGATTLQQDGSHVSGRYAYRGGQIDGTLVDHTLTFTWTEDDGTGTGVFAIANDGAMYGTWGTGDSASNGGAWMLARGGDGVGAATTTSELAPIDPHGMMTSLRMLWDVGGGGGALQVNWTGLGLDVGDRLSQHWYVGGSGDVSLFEISPLGTETEPAQSARIRLGGEVRYYFDDGVGTARINCGPAFPVPRRTWLGARIGGESLDGGSTIGTFGDVSLGTTFQLGHIGFGVYGSFGVSSEPASVFAGRASDATALATAPGTNSSAPNATSYLGSIGMIVTFGS